MTRTPVHVLLLDDEQADIDVRSLLQQAPGAYRVDAVSSPQTALSALAAGEHHVCVVGHLDTIAGGVDLVLDARAGGSRTPFVLLTGSEARGPDPEVIAEAVEVFPRGELTPAGLDRLIRYAVDTHWLEERLREQESLAQVGQFAALIAHEVRNALSGIGGALHIIRKRLPEGGEERQVTDDIQERLKSVHDMVEDLLVVVRPMVPQVATIKLERLLGELAQELESAGAPPLSVSGEAALTGDATLLRRLFRNLFQNAAQSSGPGGRIRVDIGLDGREVRVLVADDGSGIPPELREKVFQPFFSTRPQAAGLGLSIARRVVGVHGGSIRLDCPERGGTTVEVRLPIRATPVRVGLKA